MKCCLAVTLVFAVAGCSRSIVDEGHTGVQLWKDGPYWAETNIGAEKPWEYGYYFWWGDTIGYKRVGGTWVASDGSSSGFSFESKNTPTWDKDETDLRKEGWTTAGGVLAPKHDAAHAHWGGKWRMPTDIELSDLIAYCDWEMVHLNYVTGYVVRGREDYASASIFLPCACMVSGTGDAECIFSGCWSSVPESYSERTAECLEVNSYVFAHYDGHFHTTCRDRGLPVRPVQSFTK